MRAEGFYFVRLADSNISVAQWRGGEWVCPISYDNIDPAFIKDVVGERLLRPDEVVAEVAAPAEKKKKKVDVE